MAGALNVRHGSKMRLAFDAPLGQEPKFNMICTFNKALDESAFLVSIPMVGGKALPLDEKQKFLFQYEEGEETRIVAGYVDDEIREGIRHYWKIRRVSEQRQLIRRADVRMKVTLPIEYMQDTWPLNMALPYSPGEALASSHAATFSESTVPMVYTVLPSSALTSLPLLSV